MATKELQRIEVLVPAHWLDAVDHWRAKQQDIPSRDEAICRLVQDSLDLATEWRGRQEHSDVWDADVSRVADAELKLEVAAAEVGTETPSRPDWAKD
jgi:metal-responsive CopG/Arc/MetJ family transcriptional regulator